MEHKSTEMPSVSDTDQLLTDNGSV